MHQAASRQPETALSVVDTGGSQAAAVVLLHGAFRHAEDWEHQIAALRRESRVIAVDLPCHGRSGGRQHGCTVQGAAEDVRLTLAELEVSEAILVGHSFSCRVVAEMGRRWPELASGLVLVDGSRTADALTPSSSIVERMRQEGAAATLRSLFENMFLPTSPAELRDRLVTEAGSFPPGIMESVMLSSAEWDAAEADSAVAAIRCPVLAIQSTHTRPDGTRVALTTPRSGWLDFLRDRVADLAVALVPDSGHFSMLEQPDLVTRALTQFVRTLGHRGLGPATGHTDEKPWSSLYG